MVAHGGESPTRKANARHHVAHATVMRQLKDGHMNRKFCKIL